MYMYVLYYSCVKLVFYNLYIKFHNLSPFSIFSIDIADFNVTNYEILNLNNWRLVRLKLHVMYHKILVLMWKTLQIYFLFLSERSL